MTHLLICHWRQASNIHPPSMPSSLHGSTSVHQHVGSSILAKMWRDSLRRKNTIIQYEKSKKIRQRKFVGGEINQQWVFCSSLSWWQSSLTIYFSYMANAINPYLLLSMKVFGICYLSTTCWVIASAGIPPRPPNCTIKSEFQKTLQGKKVWSLRVPTRW
jgi:hypothetical protein